MPCPRPAGHPRSESRRRPGQKGCSATTGVSRFAQPAPPRATPARRAEGGRRAAQSRVRFRAGKGWMGFGWLTRRHESAKGWSPLLHSVICLQKVKHEANVNANDCSKIGLGARWRFAEVDTLKRRARELDLIKKGVGTWRQSARAPARWRGAVEKKGPSPRRRSTENYACGRLEKCGGNETRDDDRLGQTGPKRKKAGPRNSKKMLGVIGVGIVTSIVTWAFYDQQRTRVSLG